MQRKPIKYKSVGTVIGGTTGALFAPRNSHLGTRMATGALYTGVGSAAGGYAGHQIDKYRGKRSKVGTKQGNRVRKH